MFAYRTTWIVKEGRMEEALDLLNAESEQAKHLIPENAVLRAYTPDLSPNVLVFENAFDSLEDHARFWTAYNATPQAAVFWPKWHELVERAVGTERWHLAEWRG
jgi:hypothetical protein